jgi:hypothetical protein
LSLAGTSALHRTALAAHALLATLLGATAHLLLRIALLRIHGGCQAERRIGGDRFGCVFRAESLGFSACAARTALLLSHCFGS